MEPLEGFEIALVALQGAVLGQDTERKQQHSREPDEWPAAK